MKKLLIIVLLVFAVGCSKKYTKSPEETAKMPEETMKEEPMETMQEKEEVVEEIEVIKDEMVMGEDMASQEMSAEEKAQEIFQDVLFDYDKYNIRVDARPILDSAASFMNDEKDLKIAIEGHCDERGTNEYNLALGEKRAKATKAYLVSLGISPERLTIVTYGEEKQLCTDQTEACWQQNRRSHFAVIK